MTKEQWEIFKSRVPIGTQVKCWRGSRFEYWGFEEDNQPSWNFGGGREGMILAYNDDHFMLWVQQFESEAVSGHHLGDFQYLIDGKNLSLEELIA